MRTPLILQHNVNIMQIGKITMIVQINIYEYHVISAANYLRQQRNLLLSKYQLNLYAN